MTEDLTKLDYGVFLVNCIAFSLFCGVILSSCGPMLIKYLINSSQISVFSVYILLFLSNLDGVVHPVGFRFINIPINFHVAFKLFLHEAKHFFFSLAAFT